MSLFPDEDVLIKEIESWKGFMDCLPEEERRIFMKMLNDCYKYSKAINAKGQPFPSEPVIIALLLSQHKLIEWLENQWKKVRGCSET
ncbi:MAG: hypothetical protein WAM14_24310 [Candidatus Nitrosopolaris sp.]